MIIYTFWDGDAHYFASKQAAVKAARVSVKHPDNDMYDDIEVERHEIVPLTKASIISILESQGGKWSAWREVVTIVSKRKARQTTVR